MALDWELDMSVDYWIIEDIILFGNLRYEQSQTAQPS